MRFKIAAVLFACALSFCGAEVPEDLPPAGAFGPVKVAAFNVQCPFCNMEFLWPFRLLVMREIFAFHQPDLIAAQELMSDYDAGHFSEVLPDTAYTRVCRGFCDSAVYFRTDRFEMLDDGSIHLTLWPPRKALWVLLRDRGSDQTFLFVSTHFDNHQPNQSKSARTSLKRLEPWMQRGIPVIYAGDFNSSPTGRATVKNGDRAASSEGYAILARRFQNAFELAPDCGIYSNHPDPATNAFRFSESIDHIFLGAPADAGWVVRDWSVDYRWFRDPRAPRVYYPSDHWPVFATLEYRPGDSPLFDRQTTADTCEIRSLP